MHLLTTKKIIISGEMYITVVLDSSQLLRIELYLNDFVNWS